MIVRNTNSLTQAAAYFRRPFLSTASRVIVRRQIVKVCKQMYHGIVQPNPSGVKYLVNKELHISRF